MGAEILSCHFLACCLSVVWERFPYDTYMARKPSKPVTAKDLQGFKYFEAVVPMLAQLRDTGTSRDKAGNRRLFLEFPTKNGHGVKGYSECAASKLAGDW
jgi:hypothetical protein